MTKPVIPQPVHREVRYTTIGNWPIVRLVLQGGLAFIAVLLTNAYISSIDKKAHRELGPGNHVKFGDKIVWWLLAVICGSMVGKLIWDSFGEQIEAFMSGLFPFVNTFDSTTPIWELFDPSTWDEIP